MEQLTPQEAHNQRLIIGLTTALLALCWILYLLRLVSRRVCRTPLWVDDWFMAFCLVRPLIKRLVFGYSPGSELTIF